jgi:hypothetical protein
MKKRWYFSHFVSCNDALSIARRDFQSELNEIEKYLETLIRDQPYSMKEFGWDPINFGTNGIHKIHSLKNRVALNADFSSWDYTMGWLLCDCSSAFEKQLIDLLIIVRPLLNIQDASGYSIYNGRQADFEYTRDILKRLEPIPFSFPILVIGISEETTEVNPYMTYVDGTGFKKEKLMVRKLIEFPPDLYESGITILSYFGTYLADNYGDQMAKVTIEQDDIKKTLRMTVVSESGKKESIEQAYEEYRLIMSKKEPPEKFSGNEKLVQKLHNRLDILELQLRQQQRLLMVSEGHAQKYFEMLSKSLDKDFGQNPPIEINFFNQNNNDNEASVEASVEAHQNIMLAVSSISELQRLIPSDSKEVQELTELQNELESIENGSKRDLIKSPVLSKFKHLLDKISSGNGELAKAVQTAKNGYDIFKELAKTYNKIAFWCGLPKVPEVLINPGK